MLFGIEMLIDRFCFRLEKFQGTFHKQGWLGLEIMKTLWKNKTWENSTAEVTTVWCDGGGYA